MKNVLDLVEVSEEVGSLMGAFRLLEATAWASAQISVSYKTKSIPPLSFVETSEEVGALISALENND